MKQKNNNRLIPIDAIIKKGKWDEYCELAGVSDALRSAVKKNPEKYKDDCLAVPEDIAGKLGFIWKI
jgi:hypothetical protein